MGTVPTPDVLVSGTSGTLTIGGLPAGTLTDWRLVTSPTTGKPTLLGTGRFARYYAQAVGSVCEAALTPAPGHAYIGRPKPKAPQPFGLRGVLASLTATAITMASGEIVPNVRG